MGSYGAQPALVEHWDGDGWDEYMHYLYLPVKMPNVEGIRLPPNLRHFREPVMKAWINACDYLQHDYMQRDLPLYVYLTARRGFATPDNPLNRPGWHCDGFGTSDLNYVWWDRFPSRFAIGKFPQISSDHVESMRQFDDICEGNYYDGGAPRKIQILRGLPSYSIWRLTPFVVHATPENALGMRSFMKVSVSPHKYNLLGNSHNYEFDYDWEMFDRSEARNDPIYGEADFVPTSEGR